MQLYVFGYGSLMNPKSLARTLPASKETMRGSVRGYARKFNKKGRLYLYLNIVPSEEVVVSGVLIPVTQEELDLLKRREFGYDCVDVTKDVVEEVDGVVYAFMAPDNHYPELKISRRYIETCLGGLDPSEHEEWLKSSIILNEIEEAK
jgi:cation transport regulator ChaC